MSAGHSNGRYRVNGNGNGHGAADQLSERMNVVRQELQRDVAKLSDDAKQLTDWRHLVKRHPLATAGVAALIGYSLVPGKKKVVQASRQDIEALVRAGKLQVVAEGQAPAKAGLLSTTVLAVGTMAARAAMAYAGKRLGEKLEHTGSPFGAAPSE